MDGRDLCLEKFIVFDIFFEGYVGNKLNEKKKGKDMTAPRYGIGESLL